jgi:hypothetical protein
MHIELAEEAFDVVVDRVGGQVQGDGDFVA